MATPTREPRIVITPGEPAGIGPDITIALADQDIPATLVCVAAPELLRDRAAQLGRKIEIVEVAAAQNASVHTRGRLQVLPVELAAAVTPGETNMDNVPYVLTCLDVAAAGCREGVFDALVTGPVNKAIINEAGIPFTGHTEYLALQSDATLPVMMLVAGSLRVGLVTTHLPLREVSDAITTELIIRTVRIIDAALRTQFHIATPRIAVCGLNPHAGENGYLGNEEIRVIRPALATLRKAGLTVSGPRPADTAFTAVALATCDAVVAMYHDQGLPVLKAAGFGSAVNVTLGLPFVRTSVDHGTALEIAGTGAANGDSLRAAVALALVLTGR